MNRNLRLGTLATALLLAAAAMYVEPRPAHAICVCDIESGPFVTDCWSNGDTCAQAEANFPSSCKMAADNACYAMGYDGACNVSSVLNFCWRNTEIGKYTASGRVTFYCRKCLTSDP